MQKRGRPYVLARVRSEAVFARNAANVARKKQPCTNVVGRPGSKLAQQLGIERTEIFRNQESGIRKTLLGPMASNIKYT